MNYTPTDGLPWEIIDTGRDAYVLLIDGGLYGARRDREYNGGPARYLWSGFTVTEPGWIVTGSLGSFHHPSGVPDGSIAEYLYNADLARRELSERDER